VPFEASLRNAKTATRHGEGERLVRERVIGHTVAGALASIVFVAVVPLSGGVFGFSIAVIALYVALRSFAFAVSVRLGDVWGWTRDDGAAVRPTFSDRVVLAAMGWLRRRSAATVDAEPSGAVRVLPPTSFE